MTVYFVRDDLLVSTRRQLPDGSADRLGAVVQGLAAGPTDDEQARGLSTALPSGLTLNATRQPNGIVALELDTDGGGRSSSETVLAVGQLVLTVTSLPGVQAVRFTRDGQPVEALLADGALTTRPLSASDYADLKAR